jgi:hypothetical protein
VHGHVARRHGADECVALHHLRAERVAGDDDALDVGEARLVAVVLHGGVDGLEGRDAGRRVREALRIEERRGRARVGAVRPLRAVPLQRAVVGRGAVVLVVEEEGRKDHHLLLGEQILPVGAVLAARGALEGLRGEVEVPPGIAPGERACESKGPRRRRRQRRQQQLLSNNDGGGSSSC